MANPYIAYGLTSGTPRRRRENRNGRPSKVDDAGVRRIRELYDAHMLCQEIADLFGISPSVVSMIGRRLARTRVAE